MTGLEFFARADYQYVGTTWFHSVQDDETVNFFTDLSDVYGVPGFGFGISDYSRTERDDYFTLNLRAGISGENWFSTCRAMRWPNHSSTRWIIRSAPEFTLPAQ